MSESLKVRKKRLNYRTCFYRNCRSTTITTPENIFVPVPKGEVRKDWIKIVRGDEDREFSLQSPLYCCGNHFNLREDLENYTRLLLDPTANVRLKRGVKPKPCELETAPAPNRHVEARIQERTGIFGKIENSDDESCPEPKFSQFLHQSLEVEPLITIKEEYIPYKDVGVQTDSQWQPKMTSKYIQCKPIMSDAGCSPISINTSDTCN